MLLSESQELCFQPLKVFRVTQSRWQLSVLDTVRTFSGHAGFAMKVIRGLGSSLALTWDRKSGRHVPGPGQAVGAGMAGPG